ncbi:MAG: DUF2505 domain-containing protein [Propionibacteriales bacterium]|nr:DUF2505 domain-containing protein [Propionibacteriales bacterium]
MDVRAEINYPTATVEQVYALSTDPKFRGSVCEATRALSYDVNVDVHDDGTATVTVRRTMPAEVPDFVKRFVGESLDVVQTEEWGAPDDLGQRIANLTVQVTGQPVKMTGTVTIAAVGQGARTSIRGDLRVSMPFVGKRIEPEIAKGILAAAAKEQQTADEWLGEPA